MNLTAHVIAARPTNGDPLGQRGYVALIWGADNELLEFDAGMTKEEIAVSTALSIALGAAIKINPELGRLPGGQLVRMLGAYTQKVIDEADLQASGQQGAGT